MRVFTESFACQTKEPVNLIDITGEVEKIISESNLTEGVAVVFSPHTTTAVLVNENEPRLVEDFKGALKEIIPWDRSYDHNAIDSNASSHLVGAIVGCSATFLISENQIDLGTWQSIFLVELDGPRTRTVKVKIIGE